VIDSIAIAGTPRARDLFGEGDEDEPREIEPSLHRDLRGNRRLFFERDRRPGVLPIHDV